MKRVQEWLLFTIQFIVKTGVLGKYKLVSTASPEPNNAQGLKTLEKTILSLGEKNDSLVADLAKGDVVVETMERTILGLEDKISYLMSKNTEAEKRLSDTALKEIIAHKALQGKITALEYTLEQATVMSEQLQGEMIKWRT